MFCGILLWASALYVPSPLQTMGYKKILISLCGFFIWKKSDILVIIKWPGSVCSPKDHILSQINPVPTVIFLLHLLKFYPPLLAWGFQVTSPVSYSIKILYKFLIYKFNTYPPQFSPFYLITLIIFCEGCNLWSSSLRNVLSLPILSLSAINYQVFLLYLKYTVSCRSVTRQRPVNSNRGMVFSARSVPKCHKLDN
jgi:hypothetical protein